MELTFANIGVTVTFLLTILGWAYQLGRGDARLSRNEHDISELKRMQERDRQAALDEVKEIRENISKGLNRIYDQLEKLPCRNAGARPECK